MLKNSYRFILGFSLLIAGVCGWGGSASALSGSDFQAGHIIDDQVFYDSNAMSIGQIQAFLNQQVPTCDTNGDQVYIGNYGGRTYTQADHVLRRNLDARYPAPYTCLKNYYENPATHANNIGNPTSIPAGAEPAAQLIYGEAQAYGISAKVLLTTMQKESLGPLIQDDWPWPNEYTVPMGYGCPDGAACNSDYYGFFNQVHNAARQFRIYANNPNSYNYKLGTNAILYNPNSGCGTKSVNIVNMATLSLYIYTPYTPNQAALNNLYGTGDNCSSYGNRNFWRIYNDWFGSTYIPAYSAQYTGQSGYPTIIAGNTTTGYLTYKNVGAQTWYDDSSIGGAPAGSYPIHLATGNPNNRASVFGATWAAGHNRPALTFAAVYEADGTTLAANQHVVTPGQIAKFSFTFTTTLNQAPGTYREYFTPVAEGTPNGAFADPGTYLDATVQPKVFSAQYAGQSGYPNIVPGNTASGSVSFKNTGNQIWYDDSSIGSAPAGSYPIHLSTGHPNNRVSPFGATWAAGHNRPDLTFSAVYEADGTTLAANQHVVQIGQIAKFNFTFTVPQGQAGGTYREFFQPVAEGTPDGAFGDVNTYLDVMVQPAVFAAQYTGQSNYPTLSPGGTANGYFTYKNTGNQIWYDDSSIGSAPAGSYPIHLSTGHPNNRVSPFGATWAAGHNRPDLTFSAVYEADGTTLAANQHVVTPGQIAKFSFTFTTTLNQARGTYREYFWPVAEGTPTGSFNDPNTYLDVVVQ